MIKKLFFILLISIIIFICVVIASLWTTAGSRFVVRKALEIYARADFEIGESEGSLVRGMIFRNVEVNYIKDLPVGSKLKIQKVVIRLASFDLDKWALAVDNARLMLPDSDTIVLFGTFEKQALDLNIFSQGFTIREVLGYKPNLKSFIPFNGEIRDLDLFIKGSLKAPRITGDCTIKELIYKGFVFSDSFCSLDLTPKEMTGEKKLFGKVMLKTGILNTQKVLITLESGEIRFEGPLDEPRLAFQGNARVERTKINISVKGTVKIPEIVLTSEPSYSEQKLMIMLATGKSWKSVEESFNTGVFSADVTKDFIDYLFFAGQGNRFAQQLGVHDFTVTFDENTKGAGARKSITDKLEVGYAAEQKTTKENESSVSQKMQGEYQVTGQVSVGVEKEMMQERTGAALDSSSERTNSKDKIYLKYKKSF